MLCLSFMFLFIMIMAVMPVILFSLTFHYDIHDSTGIFDAFREDCMVMSSR